MCEIYLYFTLNSSPPNFFRLSNSVNAAWKIRHVKFSWSRKQENHQWWLNPKIIHFNPPLGSWTVPTPRPARSSTASPPRTRTPCWNLESWKQFLLVDIFHFKQPFFILLQGVLVVCINYQVIRLYLAMYSSFADARLTKLFASIVTWKYRNDIICVCMDTKIPQASTLALASCFPWRSPCSSCSTARSPSPSPPSPPSPSPPDSWGGRG